jgi:cyclophilin family peptidyl-prolyl cis-trans isomerase
MNAILTIPVIEKIFKTCNNSTTLQKQQIYQDTNCSKIKTIFEIQSNSIITNRHKQSMTTIAF